MKTSTSSAPVGTAVAVIANAKPGKAPRKLVAKAATKTVAKVAKKETVKTPTNGKPLKVFCGDYGLSPKRARVLLRKAWRADAGLLHSLRNRWVFSAAQERLARTVFKAHQVSPAIANESDDEE